MLLATDGVDMSEVKGLLTHVGAIAGVASLLLSSEPLEDAGLAEGLGA